MKPDKAASLFSSLTSEEKISALISLASYLTVWARDTYAVGTDAVAEPERLRLHNEIQHRVIGQLHKIFVDDEKRYPDAVFFSIIFEMAEHAGILSKVNSILDNLSRR